MLTFSFSSSFIFKVLFLLSVWLRGLMDASKGSYCSDSIKPQSTGYCVTFPGMPTLLSVITQSCHHSALCSMQMIVAGPSISVGKGCEESVLQCLYKTEDWAISWQEHLRVEIAQQTLGHSKRAQSTWMEGNQCLTYTAIHFHTVLYFLTAF